MSGVHPHGVHGHEHGADGHDEVPRAVAPVEIAPGVLELDTLLGGWHHVTAGYLLTGPAPVLIETGS